MASVDDRIVQMQFDNKSFEDKVSATISSLDKLKGSLDFANSKKGLDDFSSGAKNFNLDGIASALEGIGGKFSAMGVIAFSVLNNIVNRAVDAGISIVKSLSLDTVMDGFREYETNMNAIQTVLANTRADGTTLDDVNRALDVLNTYSDQTIYNFGEMARNIGTFTAAGVNLDTSVSAIKGIANLAAISGSNSQQASTAMYQLSQALASGRVKLMDWNSVVNAGMGGEVFQKALFETGKALGTIKDVPIDQTFEQWTAAGHTFRDSLESGWITSEVLTNTLQGFTGDLTDAQLMSMGYTADQIKEIQELGKTGKEAATKIKTLTQLVSTVKESVGSGWSASFRIIIGDFEEARAIFTAFGQAIGDVVSKSADARNELLQGWKDLGGRNLLIESIVNTWHALGAVLTAVKEAFHSVFPPQTAQSLVDFTTKIRDFTAALVPNEVTITRLKAVFEGIFSALSIGIEVVKVIGGVFADLFGGLINAVGGGDGILYFFATLGLKITELKEKLVDGNGIKDAVEQVVNKIERLWTVITGEATTSTTDGLFGLAQKIHDAFQSVKEFIDKFTVDTPQVVKDATDRIGERFGWVSGIVSGLGSVIDWVKDKFGDLKTKLDGFGQFLSDTFGDLPQKIADILANDNYDKALDTINTGFFAGLVLLIQKALKNGIKFDGGLFDNINKTFETLTSTLETMQLKIKSEILLKIAEALALLTASVVVLSLINSGSLTKSMAALAVGFGQLVTAMALLDKIASGPTSALSLGILAAGLVLVAGAIAILSVAVKVLSTMNWEELAKGLTAVTVLLGVLAATAKLLSGNSAGMVTAGVGMVAIAIALNIMALAVKSFAEMDWESMGQGLAGVAGSLLAIVGAMNLMPDKVKMVSAGVGILALATAMNVMALAVKSFAEMNWSDMARGLAGVAGSLLVIAGAMNLMPGGLILQGVGLLAIGAGLLAIAQAMQSIGGMKWGEIGKGLVGIAGALAILAVAMYAMEGGVVGAVAIGIAALALDALADVVVKFAKIGWKTLLSGLGALAVTMGVLAVGSLLLGPVIPIMLALGVALAAVGVGMVLFGAGAFLLATAFSIIATAGTQGIATLASALGVIIEYIPKFVAALGGALIELAGKILEALPGLIASLGKVIGALLQLLIDNIPKLAETFKTFILEGLGVIKDLVPELVDTGFFVLLSFLKGIRDNIGEIVTVVSDIITNFLDALSLKVPEIIDSVYNFVISVLEGVVNKLTEVAKFLLPKGVEFLEGLLQGLINKSADVLNWFTELPGKILGWIGDALGFLVNTGKNFLTGLLNGLINKVGEVTSWFTSLPGKILGWIGDAFTWLIDKGKDILGGLFSGILQKGIEVGLWFLGLAAQVVNWISDAASWLVEKGKDVIRGLWEGIKAMGSWIKDKILGWIDDYVTGPFKSFLDIFSPSKLFMKYGNYIGEGLMIGIDDMGKPVYRASEALGQSVTDGFAPDLTSALSKALQEVSNNLNNLDEFNPTIKPVLDLTGIMEDAKSINTMFAVPNLAADVSYAQANVLAADQQIVDTTSTDISAPVIKEIKFEQNNFSPTALSVGDLYRQTRNQIALAKEELSIT